MADELKVAVAQVKAAYVFSDYARQHGLNLKASGPGKWKALCQFHNDSKPSMIISDDFQNYRCWSCSATGDFIKWVMETEQLEFMEALKKLAEDKGIVLNIGQSSEPGIDYTSLRECLRETANFFVAEYRKLPKDHAGRTQILDRGLSEKGMIYGYAPDNRTALVRHLQSKNFSDETILQAGVAKQWDDSKKLTDFWSGRLMFVFTDATGKPIGFAGRKLFDGDKGGKFINSPAGPLFDKSSALFNIQNAKNEASKSHKVFVAEGQFDVAAFVEAGIPNVVASSGTAFTPKHGQILQRLVGDSGKVVFAFDGDTAGIDAASKVFMNVPMLHSTAWVTSFPEGKDPCDLRLESGNEALVKTANTMVPLVEFVLNSKKSDYDMRSDLGRSQYLDYAASVLKTVSSNSLRATLLRKIALDTFTEVDSVREAVSKAEPLQLAREHEEDHTEKAIPDELADTKSTPILEMIERDESYALAARFIALSLLDRSLIQYLPKNRSKLPKEFRGFVDDLAGRDPNASIIAESFDESDLVSYLVDPELFPNSSLAQFNARDQFSYVFKRYMAVTQEKQENEVQARIHSILAADGADPKLLEEALESEARFVEERSV